MIESLKDKTTAELLTLHAAIMEELRGRNVLRSSNNPTGDLAEYLFCKCFGWKQAAPSEKGFDAIGDGDVKYQIKGRRIHRRNPSRQLSAIRDLTGFHVLAAVLFDDDYTITRAALIPAATVREMAVFVGHTNSHKFILRDSVWSVPGVLDVTDWLRAVP